MIIHKYPIDGLKGQKQIAYGNAVGHGNIRYRPERAKAQSLFLLLPFQGDWSASHLPKAMPWAIISLPRWGVSVNYLLLTMCVLRYSSTNDRFGIKATHPGNELRVTSAYLR